MPAAEYMKQYERVKRFLARVEDQDREQISYEDDLWSFFQHCWHLKDWIKYDSSLPQSVSDKIESEVKNYKWLMIAADLANRSKHSQLQKFKRVDADVKSVGVTVHVPTLHRNVQKGETTTVGECRSEYHYTISTDDGSEYDALKVARNAVRDWEQLIDKLGIRETQLPARQNGKTLSVEVSENISFKDGQQEEKNIMPILDKPKKPDLSLHPKIRGRVKKHEKDFPNAWEHFKFAWRAFPMRFTWCDHFDKTYCESFNRAGSAPQPDERVIQERTVFTFFATGLSAIDTYCYALYMVGHMVASERFPIDLKKHLRAITPFSTKDKFAAEFPSDTISVSLARLVKDAVFDQWKSVRNDLIHCSAPGRIINLSSGGPPSQDDVWRHIDFEIPINADTTRSRRNWLADILSSLQAATDELVIARL